MTSDRAQITRRTLLAAAAGGVAAQALPDVAAARAPGALHGVLPAAAQPPASLDNHMTTDAEWSAFLHGQDLLWKRLPTVWYDGPFLGDGRLGSMVYRESGQNQVRFTVQHAEVQDHRPEFGS